MRVKVEQTFGTLKSRFPALRLLGQRLRSRRNQARAHAFIVAAVVLHTLFLNEPNGTWTIWNYSRSYASLSLSLPLRIPCLASLTALS